MNCPGRIGVLIAVLLSHGSPPLRAQFTPAAGGPFPTGSGPQSVETGDFNRDGKLDLVVANNAANTVTVLLGNGSGGFTAAAGSPFAVGTGPASVAVGDFNGDGKPDIVTANTTSNTVTVLLGTGSGGFAAAPGSPFSVGAGPVFVLAVDVNSDGATDILTANSATNTISILLGNGAGGFTASAAPPATGGFPAALAVADLNGDGRPDIVAANFSDGTVSVFLATVSGFATATTQTVGASPVSVAIGDLNLDGIPDIVTANFGDSTVTELLGRASGGFAAANGSPFPVGSKPYSILVGDWNGDGQTDFATADHSGNTVTVMLGAGSAGGFSAFPGSPFSVGRTPFSLASGDFNGDGKPDLAVANMSDNNVIVLLNTLPAITAVPATITLYAGTGQPAPAAVPVAVRSTVSGSTYVVTTAVTTSKTWITPAPATNATGSASTVTVAASAASLAAGTYSGSVRFNAPSFFGASTAVRLAVNSPSGAFAPATSSPVTVGTGPQSVVLADFNGDGNLDLATANFAENNVTVLLGDGAGGFTPSPSSPFSTGNGPASIVTADFNGDGNPDVATANKTAGTVTVLLGNGSGGFVQAIGSPFTVGALPLSVAAADFNGDGKPDLATANSGGASVTVLLNTGSGAFAQAPGSPITVPASPQAIATGDLNGDGWNDIAVAGYSGNFVTPLLGNGGGGFTRAPAGAVAAGSFPQALAIADLNADGNQDLVVANSGGATVTILLGNGAGGYTRAAGSPFPTGTNPGSVAVGDFNGDGKPDLVLGNLLDNTVTMLFGNGSGVFTPAPGSPYAVGQVPYSVAVGDFNRDGKSDLVTVNYGDGNATVLLGAQAPTTSVITTSAGATVVYGTSVPLTLTVSQTAGGSVVSTGAGTFLDSGTLIGTAAQTKSPYTYSATGLPAGTHTFTGAYGGDTASASSVSAPVTVTVSKAPQTITFATLTDKPYSTTTFDLTATASSGLAVQFASGTPLVCTLSGATVSLAGVGSCTIQATQAGDTNRLAATPVNRTFTVRQASQTITFASVTSVAAGSAPFDLTATASSGLPVTFASSSPPVCTVSGVTVTIVSAGTCTIQALQPGNANYTAAAGVTQRFSVSPGPQAITFGSLQNQAFGTAPISLSATASSGLTVSFGSATAPVCTVNGATVTLVSAGTCTINATQAGNSSFAAASPVSQSFMVTPGSQTITFAAIPGQAYSATPIALTATASSKLVVSLASATASNCTVTGTQVTILSVGDCTIQASQPGNANYGPAPSVAQTFTVTQASQTITFAPLTGKSFGAAPFPLTATASSGLPVIFASGTQSLCTVSGSVLTILAAGTCSIQAAQAGNTNYSAATAITQNIVVTPGSQTITFGAIPPQATGGTLALTATASSGLPVSFASTSPAVCTVSGAQTTMVAAGSCVIQATQAGDPNYAAAAPVKQTFSVSSPPPGPQSITFGTLTNQPFGTPPFALTATASSGLTVSFASTTASVCTVSGVTVTLISAGTCAINATQAGNASFAAATPVSQSFKVTPVSQTITFGSLQNQPFGTAPFALTATASSGLTVSFGSTTAPVCTVNSDTVTLVSAGTCTINATQAGNSSFAAAAPVSQSFTVTPGSQTITFAAIPGQAYSATPIALTAMASSKLVVSFASATASNCTVTGTQVTILSSGDCTIQASQPGNANYGPAPSVAQTFTVTQANQTITFASLTGKSFGAAPFTLTATASSGLPVTFASGTQSLCNVSGAVLTILAAGTCTIQAAQAGNTNYGAAPAITQNMVVTPGSQTIAFGTIASQAAGGQPLALSATASSGLPVAFASTTATVCTVSGTQATMVAPGSCSIQATQAGNANYAAATPVKQTFTVSLGAVTIASVANAASYNGNQLAAGACVTVFGTGFASSAAQATTATLPTSLGGTTVAVTDSTGTSRPASLYYVSPTQVNFLIPAGAASGGASVSITNSAGATGSFSTTIAAISPAFFTADGSGSGVPAAIGLRFITGTVTPQTVAVFNCGGTPVTCTASPIDLSVANSAVYLELFGTGIRGRSGLSGVTATVGGVAVPVTWAGPQGTYAGLDQVNVLLDKSLAGKGSATLRLTVDGLPANAVTINIK